MAKDTITLKLDGDVPFDLYAAAIGNFNALIKALSEEVSGNTPIEWTVEGLASGSAKATARGFANDPIAVEKVVIASGIVGRALVESRPIPYSDEVVNPAIGLTGVLNGHIHTIQIITDNDAVSITEQVKVETQRQVRRLSLGVVTGHVYAISDEPRPKISLRDDLFGRAVVCYLGEGKYDLAREVWRQHVAVMGMVHRDPYTGKPIQITDVISVTPAEEKKAGSFLAARGIMPWREGDEPSELMIRRMRDAE